MERKNPFESNNGLRATDRTSQSISLAWPPLNDDTLTLTQSSQDEETKSNDKPEISPAVDTTTEENEVKQLANRLSTLTHRTGNWIEVQMKKGEQAVDWFSIYKYVTTRQLRAKFKIFSTHYLACIIFKSINQSSNIKYLRLR